MFPLHSKALTPASLQAVNNLNQSPCLVAAYAAQLLIRRIDQRGFQISSPAVHTRRRERRRAPQRGAQLHHALALRREPRGQPVSDSPCLACELLTRVNWQMREFAPLVRRFLDVDGNDVG